MKRFLVILLVFLCTSSFAQQHSVFADVGWSPGFSVTYNYKPTKRLAIGVGIQGYMFTPTQINTRRFVPALFADLRLNIRPEKNNQFFSLLDLGINFYKQDAQYRTCNNIVYNKLSDNGFYSGLGFGYLRRMTNRGGGPYASLKLIMNWTTVEGYDIVTREQKIGLLNMDGNLVLSLGFKF